MKGSETQTIDVADKIANLIVNEKYISKEALIPKIDAYLKIFVKQQSMPKLLPKDLKQESILLQKQMNFVLNEQQRYLGSQLNKLVDRETMQVHNAEMVKIRESYGVY